MHAFRLATAFTLLVLSPAAVHAHAMLDHASPSVGSTVSGPREVRLYFTQALEPRFSAAQLRSSSGAVVGTGHVDRGDPKQIVISVRGLAPGRYKVDWKVLSVDTHRTEGNFGFEVKP